MGVIQFRKVSLEDLKMHVLIEKGRIEILKLLDQHTFEKVNKIIEDQPFEKREAFYGTIREAALAGEDFSKVHTIQDIANVYACFIVKRAMGSYGGGSMSELDNR